MPAVVDGTVQPGKVFDQVVPLEETARAYRAMDERTAIKVLIAP